MKVQSNHPELDGILNAIWEDFSPTEDTKLHEALALCHARVKELEAQLDQRVIADEIFDRTDERIALQNMADDSELDSADDCCDCLLCQVNAKLKADSLKN
jgi:hypothetical protein